MSNLIYNGKIISFGGGVVNLPFSIPEDGLVAEWLFDNNFLDTSGNGNDGSGVNNPPFVSNRHGVANSAVSINGTSDLGQYISLSNTSIIGTTDKFSMSFWTYVTLPGETSRRTIYGEFVGGSDLRNWTVLRNDRFDLNQVPPGGTSFRSSSISYFDTWIHYAYIRNGSYQAIYINSKLNTEDNLGRDYTGDESTSAAIGDTPSLPDRHYTGYLDDIRFYNRPLQYHEIYNLYRE